jgi:hypothetical protein
VHVRIVQLTMLIGSPPHSVSDSIPQDVGRGFEQIPRQVGNAGHAALRQAKEHFLNQIVDVRALQYPPLEEASQRGGVGPRKGFNFALGSCPNKLAHRVRTPTNCYLHVPSAVPL